MAFKPEKADDGLEKEMEEKALPDSDRDELRRFSQVLRRKKAKRAGEVLPPAPEGMIEWLKGEDKDEVPGSPQEG